MHSAQGGQEERRVEIKPAKNGVYATSEALPAQPQAQAPAQNLAQEAPCALPAPDLCTRAHVRDAVVLARTRRGVCAVDEALVLVPAHDRARRRQE